MAEKRKVRQGDIFMCNLTSDAIEHEQKGVRPVLVMSLDARNETSQNVFIFPITHARKKLDFFRLAFKRVRSPLRSGRR